MTKIPNIEFSTYSLDTGTRLVLSVSLESAGEIQLRTAVCLDQKETPVEAAKKLRTLARWIEERACR